MPVNESKLSNAPSLRSYRCFGVAVAAPLAFPGAWRRLSAQSDPTVLVSDSLGQPSSESAIGWQGISDDQRFVVRRGPAGQHRFTHGESDLFELSADFRTLISAPIEDRSFRWWRVLLDSVLLTVGLLRGKDALHAGCVATPNGAVAICALTGGGKSTLTAELMRQGNGLVTDDILFLEPRGDQLLAHPGPPVMTVPAGLGFTLGSPLAKVGAEVWTAVPTVEHAVPLRRLVLLERTPGARTAPHGLDQPLATLLTHLLTFPRTPERELSRFELAADLIAHVEIVRLVADTSTTPQELAELAMSGIT